MANQPFDIDNEDLNGDCFVIGTEGEPEEDIALNHVYFPDGSPAANDGTACQAVNYTAAQALAFIKVNTYHLFNSGVAFTDALYLSYLRFLAARSGLISPEFTVNVWYVKYNDARRLTADETARYNAGFTHGNEAQFANEPQFTQAWQASSNAIDKAKARRMFSDIVCCIAYMFRVRGHHYRPDLDTRYKTLWIRCLHVEADLQSSWQNIATTGLHAVMPAVLDQYWQQSVQNSSCAGTLIKRYDSAPAGAAGIMALKKGLDDVNMIFPNVVDRVPQSKQSFDTIYNQVSNSRWGASINARFYGANRIQFNEADVGALASVVLGIYEQLAPNAELRDSLALQRLAKIAPATGGAIGQAALRTTRSDHMLLLENA